MSRMSAAWSNHRKEVVMNLAKYLSCFLVIFLSLGVLSVHAKPHWIQDGGDSPLLRYDWLAVSAANDSAAWAAGESGKYAIKRFGSIFGGNWIGDELPSYDPSGIEDYRLNDVFVLPTSPGHVWIVGEKVDPDTSDNHKGVVIYTRNGGDDWYWVYPLEDDEVVPLTPLYAVCFADTAHGYIAAGNGIVLKTTNGGVDWTKTGSSPGSESDCFVDIWTPSGSGDTVWVVSDNSAVIAKSTNGGVSWTQCQTSDFDRTYDIPDLGSPYDGKLANFDHAYCCSNSRAIALSHGKVARSTDNGESWSVDSIMRSPIWFEAGDYYLGAVCFLQAWMGS